MVASNSESYPYLSVAQQYRVSYSQVLRLVDILDKDEGRGWDNWSKGLPTWARSTVDAWVREQDRRKRTR